MLSIGGDTPPPRPQDQPVRRSSLQTRGQSPTNYQETTNGLLLSKPILLLQKTGLARLKSARQPGTTSRSDGTEEDDRNSHHLVDVDLIWSKDTTSAALLLVAHGPQKNLSDKLKISARDNISANIKLYQIMSFKDAPYELKPAGLSSEHTYLVAELSSPRPSGQDHHSSICLSINTDEPIEQWVHKVHEFDLSMASPDLVQQTSSPSIPVKPIFPLTEQEAVFALIYDSRIQETIYFRPDRAYDDTHPRKIYLPPKVFERSFKDGRSGEAFRLVPLTKHAGRLLSYQPQEWEGDTKKLEFYSPESGRGTPIDPINLPFFPPASIDGAPLERDKLVYALIIEKFIETGQNVICLDLGASSISVSYSPAHTNTAHALRLGIFQKSVDLTHSEIDHETLVSANVAVWKTPAKSVRQRDHDTSFYAVPIHNSRQRQSTHTVEIPFPVFGALGVPPEFQKAAEKERRFLGHESLRTHPPSISAQIVALETEEGLQPPIAISGYKIVACGSGGDEDRTVQLTNYQAEPSGIYFAEDAASIFAAATESICANLIVPYICSFPEFTDEDFDSFSNIKMVMTCPSGLTDDRKESVYFESAIRGLSHIQRGGPDGDDWQDLEEDEKERLRADVMLVSEPMASAYNVVTNTSLLTTRTNNQINSQAPISYPVQGDNQLVVIDIGESTADFAICEFNDDNPASFNVISEFGTMLGGRKLDQALYLSCLSELYESLKELKFPKELQKKFKLAPQLSNAEQRYVVGQSKKRFSDIDVGKDRLGAVEIELATFEDTDDNIKIHRSFISDDHDHEALKDILEWLSKKVGVGDNEHTDDHDDKSFTNTKRPWLQWVITKQSASGKRLSNSHEEGGWGVYDRPVARLVLRLNVTALLNHTNSHKLRTPGKSAVEIYFETLGELLRQSIKFASKHRKKESANKPIWYLFTGRTTLYPAFGNLPDHDISRNPDGYFPFNPSEKDQSNTSRRLFFKLGGGSVAEQNALFISSLKNTVVEGAVKLTSRHIRDISRMDADRLPFYICNLSNLSSSDFSLPENSKNFIIPCESVVDLSQTGPKLTLGEGQLYVGPVNLDIEALFRSYNEILKAQNLLDEKSSNLDINTANGRFAADTLVDLFRHIYRPRSNLGSNLTLSRKTSSEKQANGWLISGSAGIVDFVSDRGKIVKDYD